MATISQQEAARAASTGRTYTYQVGNKVYSYKKNLGEPTGRKDKLLSVTNVETGQRNSFRSSGPSQGSSGIQLGNRQSEESTFRGGASTPKTTQSAQATQQRTQNVQVYRDEATGQTLAPYSTNPRLYSQDQPYTSRFQPVASTQQLRPEGSVSYATPPQTTQQRRPTPPVNDRTLSPNERIKRGPRAIVQSAIDRIGFADSASKVITRQSTPAREATGLTTRTLRERTTPYEAGFSGIYTAVEPPARVVQRGLQTYAQDTREFNKRAFGSPALRTLAGPGATAAEIGSGTISQFREKPVSTTAITGVSYFTGQATGYGSTYLTNLAGRGTAARFGVDAGLRTQVVTQRAVNYAGGGLFGVSLARSGSTEEVGRSLPSALAFGGGFGAGVRAAQPGFQPVYGEPLPSRSNFQITQRNRGFVQVTEQKTPFSGTLFGKPTSGVARDYTVLVGSRTAPKTGEYLFRGRQVSSAKIGGDVFSRTSADAFGAISFGRGTKSGSLGLFLEPGPSGAPQIIGSRREFVVETGIPKRLFKTSSRKNFNIKEGPFFARRSTKTTKELQALSATSTELIPGQPTRPVKVTNYLQRITTRNYKEAIFRPPRQGEFAEATSLRISSQVNDATGFFVGQSRRSTISKGKITAARNVAIRAGAGLPDPRGPTYTRESARLRNQNTLERIRRSALLRGRKGSFSFLQEPSKIKTRVPTVQRTYSASPSRFIVPKITSSLTTPALGRVFLLGQPPRQRSVTQQRTSQRSVQRQFNILNTESLARTIPKVTQRQAPISIVGQRPTTRTTQRQVPVQAIRTAQRQIPRNAINPLSFSSGRTPPPFSGGFFALPSVVGLRPSKRGRGKQRGFAYTPDILSSALNIRRRSKRRSKLAESLGFGIRGL